MSAIMRVLIKKPSRRNTLSAIDDEPTFISPESVCRSNFSPRTRKIRYPSGRVAYTNAIAQDTAVPHTVAIAAPRTPSFGKPKFPPIRQ